MQLYYYRRRDRQPNFGDELNTWLWPKLLPNCFDDDNAACFVGMGTVLNQRLPSRIADAKQVFIFSSGVGYEMPLTKIPSHWQIFCVRGPRSARQLRLPPNKAITDGGVLVRQCFQSIPSEHSNQPRMGFMPHIHHASSAQAAWASLCQDANLRYIDPRGSVDSILTAISQTGVLYAEAMHGAIVADALRVPWVPVITSPRILRFKWQDWCESMQLSYRPQILSPIPDYPRYGRGLRSGGRSLFHWFQSGTFPMAQQRDTILNQLTRLAQVEPVLSQAKILEQRTDALLTALALLK